MANTFFTATGVPSTRSVATSSAIRQEISSIEGAFDKLPAHYGGATLGFNGGSWKDGTFENASLTDCYHTNLYGLGSHYLGTSATLTGASPTAVLGSNQVTAIYSINTGTLSAGIGYGPGTTHNMIFDKFSNIMFGDGSNATATTATEKFLMIPTCAGTPTGTPAHTYSSSVPFIYDSTNNKLYIYDGGWLGTAALT